MAKKRMFRLDVLETDAFMDMPISAQALYFHLNLRADDDGFIGNPRQIVRAIGVNQNDLDMLIAKKFVLSFDDGVIVIKHWRLHNTLTANRYSETKYLEDKGLLRIKENNAYTFSDDGKPLNDTRIALISKRQGVRQTKDEQKTNNRQAIDKQKTNNRQTKDKQMAKIDEPSIDKDSIGKVSIEKNSIDNNPPLSPHGGKRNTTTAINERGFADPVREILKTWVKYKNEKHQSYKETGFAMFLTQVENRVAEYGGEAVVKVISESMAQNYTGVCWDWLKKAKPVADGLEELLEDGDD